MISFFSWFGSDPEERVPEIVVKLDDGWRAIDASVHDALLTLAQHIVDAEGTHGGFDPRVEILCGAKISKNDYFLQLRTDELTSPPEIFKAEATVPSTLVFGRGDDVRPLALWLPNEGRVNQNAHAVLQKLDAKPSGKKTTFDANTFLARRVSS